SRTTPGAVTPGSSSEADICTRSRTPGRTMAPTERKGTARPRGSSARRRRRVERAGRAPRRRVLRSRDAEGAAPRPGLGSSARLEVEPDVLAHENRSRVEDFLFELGVEDQLLRQPRAAGVLLGGCRA